jgi:hypothetical protein
MTVHPSPPHGEARPAAHEPDLVSVRGVVIVGLILGAVVVAALVGLSLLYQRLQLKRESERPAAWRQEERPPIDFDQPAQLKALREWENRELNTYGWRDQEQTAARVPIERAMEMLVEHGDPFVGASEGPAKSGPSTQPANEPNEAKQQNTKDAEKTDETEQ